VNIARELGVAAKCANEKRKFAAYPQLFSKRPFISMYFPEGMMERLTRIRWVPRVEQVAIVVSACLVLVTAFQWSLVELLTPFLMVPLQGILWLLFIIVAVWSVVHSIRYRKQRRNLIPAIICAASLGMVTLVPFTKIWLHINFASNKSARERVVQEVSEGTLTPNRVFANGVGMISLPNQTWNISAGGNEIEMAKRDGKTYVFFFTFRGILNSYSGFLYVPTGGDPSAFSDVNEDPRVVSVRYDNHWFFVSHRN